MAKIPVYNWNTDSIPTQVMRPGCNDHFFRGSDVLIGHAFMEPGVMERVVHSHPYEQIAMIMRGQCEFLVGDQLIQCTPGTVFRIPPNVPHGALPIGDEVCVNVDVWAPARPDYAKFTTYQTDDFDR